MALPKFNETPVYQLTIPSTKRIVKFRPFLVKEQKILLMALESQDETQVLESILRTIQSCILEKINPSDFSTFDVEYIFAQIRAKSVGEKTTLLFECPVCKTKCESVVNLEEVNIEIPDKDNTVPINEEYTLHLRYPNYEDVIKESRGSADKTDVEKLYDLVCVCLGSLNSNEEKISFRDEPREEIENFLNSLNPEIFEKILKFTQELPSLKHETKFYCEPCDKEHTRNLKGLSDFFMYASPTSL